MRRCPTNIAVTPGRSCVYVGAAEHRVDIELMLRGVTELRHLRWVVIGPFEGAAGERLRAAGALVLGSRPHEQLAGYLRHAHVGIVPFSFTRHGELIREVSPLKVVEYAACGLPVVGTQGCQYPTDLPTPLAVCRSAGRIPGGGAEVCCRAPGPSVPGSNSSPLGRGRRGWRRSSRWLDAAWDTLRPVRELQPHEESSGTACATRLADALSGRMGARAQQLAWRAARLHPVLRAAGEFKRGHIHAAAGDVDGQPARAIPRCVRLRERLADMAAFCRAERGQASACPSPHPQGRRLVPPSTARCSSRCTAAAPSIRPAMRRAPWR